MTSFLVGSYTSSEMAAICQNLSMLGMAKDQEHLCLQADKKKGVTVYFPACTSKPKSICSFYKPHHKRIQIVFEHLMTLLNNHKKELSDKQFVEKNILALQHVMVYLSVHPDLMIYKLRSLIKEITPGPAEKSNIQQELVLEASQKVKIAKTTAATMIANLKQQVAQAENTAQSNLDAEIAKNKQTEQAANAQVQAWQAAPLISTSQQPVNSFFLDTSVKSDVFLMLLEKESKEKAMQPFTLSNQLLMQVKYVEARVDFSNKIINNPHYIPLLERMAKTHASAQFILGLVKLKIPKSEKTGFKLLENAGKKHVEALWGVYFCYHKGLGVNKNYKEALLTLNQLAFAGDLDAQLSIIQMCNKCVPDLPIELRLPTTLTWMHDIKKTSLWQTNKQACGDALLIVANSFLRGKGIKQNLDKALSLFDEVVLDFPHHIEIVKDLMDNIFPLNLLFDEAEKGSLIARMLVTDYIYDYRANYITDPTTIISLKTIKWLIEVSEAIMLFPLETLVKAQFLYGLFLNGGYGVKLGMKINSSLVTLQQHQEFGIKAMKAAAAQAPGMKWASNMAFEASILPSDMISFYKSFKKIGDN